MYLYCNDIRAWNQRVIRRLPLAWNLMRIKQIYSTHLGIIRAGTTLTVAVGLRTCAPETNLAALIYINCNLEVASSFQASFNAAASPCAV